MNITITLFLDQMKSLIKDAEIHKCSVDEVISRRLLIQLPPPVSQPNSPQVVEQMKRGQVKPKPHTSAQPFQLMGGVPLANLYDKIIAAEKVTVDDLLSIILHAPKNRMFTVRELIDALHPSIKMLIGPAMQKSLAQLFYKKVKALPKGRSVRYNGAASPIKYWVEG